MTNKEALELALITLERDNLKVGNIYVNYDIQKALIKLVKKELEKKEWVGLTDAEIEGAIDEGLAFGLDDGNVSNRYVIQYVRVIEALLKEKNGG